MRNLKIYHGESVDDVARLKLLLSDLLDELKYVHSTFDVADSIKNSRAESLIRKHRDLAGLAGASSEASVGPSTGRNTLTCHR